MRKRGIIRLALLGLALAGSAAAQQFDGNHPADDDAAGVLQQMQASDGFQTPLLPATPAQPRLAPELALDLVQAHAKWQSLELTAYTDTEQIEAQLPDTAQKGEFELVREYVAPNALKFKPVRFTGDGFVKQNVITRLLQQEVDHVEKGDGDKTALNQQNYKFSYKGTEKLDGRDVHVFAVKPRRKEPGLFKGKIYVDSFTGTLRRAEGTVVKSPSFFIKKIEFVQDYDDINGFTFPVKMRSTAITRIVGRAVVNIFHRNYQLRAAGSSETATLPTVALQ